MVACTGVYFTASFHHNSMLDFAQHKPAIWVPWISLWSLNPTSCASQAGVKGDIKFLFFVRQSLCLRLSGKCILTCMFKIHACMLHFEVPLHAIYSGSINTQLSSYADTCMTHTVWVHFADPLHPPQQTCIQTIVQHPKSCLYGQHPNLSYTSTLHRVFCVRTAAE